MIRLEFCDRYGYPDEVKQLFKRLLSPINPRRVRSVLLYGSPASGEMGFRYFQEKLRVYSDFDLVMIAEGRKEDAYERELRDFYRSLEEEHHDTYPRIDFMYMDLGDLKRGLKNRPDLQYQMKDVGITLFGEDMRSYIPTVEARQLTLQFKMGILLSNLWHIILSVPEKILLGKQMSEPGLHRWGYLLSKFFFELIRWILMMEGVLVTTYQGRKEYIRRHFSALRASRYFSFDMDVVEEWYSVKTRLLLKREPLSLCVGLLEQYLATREYLQDSLGIRKEEEAVLFSDAVGIPTPDGSISRRIFDLYLLFSKLRPLDPERGFQWLAARKYCLIIDFLYSMHRALHCHLTGRHDEAAATLAASRHFLRIFILNSTALEGSPSGDFIEEWLHYRRLSDDFRYDYFPSLKRRQG